MVQFALHHERELQTGCLTLHICFPSIGKRSAAETCSEKLTPGVRHRLSAEGFACTSRHRRMPSDLCTFLTTENWHKLRLWEAESRLPPLEDNRLASALRCVCSSCSGIPGAADRLRVGRQSAWKTHRTFFCTALRLIPIRQLGYSATVHCPPVGARLLRCCDVRPVIVETKCWKHLFYIRFFLLLFHCWACFIRQVAIFLLQQYCIQVKRWISAVFTLSCFFAHQ